MLIKLWVSAIDDVRIYNYFNEAKLCPMNEAKGGKIDTWATNLSKDGIFSGVLLGFQVFHFLEIKFQIFHALPVLRITNLFVEPIVFLGRTGGSSKTKTSVAQTFTKY